MNTWVEVRPDETVVIRVARSEMGQGTATGLAQLVAEELECDWSKVTIEYSTPGDNVARERVWGSMLTGGSRGIRDSQELVRKGGAAAFLWSRGTAARETLRYLDTNGIDAEPLLSKAELSRTQLSQDAGGISAASQCRFLDLAATAANDQLLGLHVAAEMDIRDAGLLFYLAAASATVTEALEHLARYAGTANEAVRFEISHHKGETVLTIRPIGGQDEPRRQFSEFIAAGRHSSAE